MAYNFHIDPGHGWVEVPFSELVQLGIHNQISTYSYRKGDMCYLEEDCDAATWDIAYQQKHGHTPDIKYVHHDGPDDPPCFIRTLNRYNPNLMILIGNA